MARRGGSMRRIALWVACLAAMPAGAEWLQLSWGQAFSDIQNPKVSPDGKWVVYSHDAETDDAFEIWSVRLPSGLPTRISGLFPANGIIYNSQISPDSTRVIFKAPSGVAGLSELWSVPIGGPSASAVKLNGTLVAGGSVETFSIAPDSSRVVYQADQQTDGVSELYSVPLAGPASSGVKLNAELVAGGHVTANLWISPNSSRVIYLADQQTAGVDELYSVPLAGPANLGVKLNGALSAQGDVMEAEISADSSRVVYLADQQADNVHELYSVPLAGPANLGVKLNGALVAEGDVMEVAISADSSRVVYLADQQTNDVPELYSVPLAGPAASGIKLNGALVAGGAVFDDFLISPDSSRVLYRADQQTNGVIELYSVQLEGPAASGTKLNGPLGANGNVQAGGVAISPDSGWVVYIADQELDGVPTGHRVPLDGPAGSEEQIWYSAYNPSPSFEILPDASAVAVRGNHTLIDGIVRLWTYPLAGTPDPEGTDWLWGEFQPAGDCVWFDLLPDGSGAIYWADQDIDVQYDLYLLYFRLWGDGFETGDTSRWSTHLP